MTRVGIMTFLHNDNYGSTLQAWALQKTLTELGFDAEHIDYRPDRLAKLRNLASSGNSPRLIVEGMRKRAVASSREGAAARHASFPTFYAREMRLSAPCRNRAALRRQAAAYDVLLAGSDQIWSPVWLNPAYFLDFAAKNQPCVAYAASLGVRELPPARKARKMAALIRRFSAISLREEEGAALLERIGGQAYPVTPDPVCLIPPETWRALAEQLDETQPYLLCYLIGDRPDYWPRIQALSEQTGLPVRVVPVTESAYRSGYALSEGVSPTAWLGEIAGAAHVCTDSFHATVFATLLHRPFTALQRDRGNDPENKNSRVDNWLRLTGLTRDNLNADWEAVDARLDALRKQGRAWLAEAINRAAAR